MYFPGKYVTGGYHRQLVKIGLVSTKGYPNLSLACGVYRYYSFPIGDLTVQQHIYAGILNCPKLFIRHEILRKMLFLLTLQPGKVRLVIGKNASHQFNIRTIFIGKVSVPGLPEVAASPSPLLFARGNMMVGNMEDACLFGIVIAPDKIIFAFIGHIGSGDGKILITGNIHAHAVIMLIVFPGRYGKLRDSPLAMVENRVDIGWKN